MDEILKVYEPQIESFSLVPSDGGRFEITVNDEFIYSKLQTNRHLDQGEATLLVEKYLQEGT